MILVAGRWEGAFVLVLLGDQEVSDVCWLLDTDQKMGFLLLFLDYRQMRTYY